MLIEEDKDGSVKASQAVSAVTVEVTSAKCEGGCVDTERSKENEELFRSEVVERDFRPYWYELLSERCNSFPAGALTVAIGNSRIPSPLDTVSVRSRTRMNKVVNDRFFISKTNNVIDNCIKMTHNLQIPIRR